MESVTKYILCLSAIISLAASCSDAVDLSLPDTRDGGGISGGGSRNETEDTRRTLLLYSAGNNNLSDALIADIEDICNGYVPSGNYAYSDALLVFASNYKTRKGPCLIRIYKDGEDVVRDTVRVWPSGTSAADTGTLSEVLDFVRGRYPSGEFGMIFSSHSTGWLPEGTDLTDGDFPALSLAGKPQRSIGADSTTGEEMDIRDFAAALPFRMDYMIFDACLLGGIEVAYELKDKTRYLLFSPEEILADGMVYTNIVSRLLQENPTNLQGAAEDYYNHYNAKQGLERSALISLIDCASLGNLAEVCARIFGQYGSGIPYIDPLAVQKLNNNDTDPRYPRSCYFFYDFLDIIGQLPLTESEKAETEDALDECVVYKANTENSFGQKIETFCGLSMYLPSAVGNSSIRTRLNKYYLGYKWAQDTGYPNE